MTQKTWIFRLTVILISMIAHGAKVQPNIVVFLVDDMGLMDTSVPMLTDADGTPKRYPLNDWYRTPSMERLAEQGIRFSNFYAQNTCSPTRISIMTGKNAARHRTTIWISPKKNNRGKFGPPEWNWKGLTRDDITLPGLLKKEGYRTMMFGKAHFGPTGSEGADPLNLGFDVNIGGCSSGHPASYYGTQNFARGDSINNVPHLEKYHGQDIFLTEALTREAIAQIKQSVQEKKPFYVYMSHYAVHGPFQSDPRFAAHYADSDKSKQARAYATMIEGMDKSLGDIMDELDTLGVAENTFIIFLGDNGSDAPLGDTKGYASSAPLRGKKGTEYEGGSRVPFIAGWAKLNPDNPLQKRCPVAVGSVQSQLGTVDDIFPTVLSLVDAKIPDGYTVDGVDLAPQFTGKQNPDRSDTFLMHLPHQHRVEYATTYCKGDWKVIYYYNPQTPDRPEYKLYNLKDDPIEANDLAAAQPEKLRQIMQAMVDDMTSKNALYPVNAEGNTLKPVVP